MDLKKHKEIIIIPVAASVGILLLVLGFNSSLEFLQSLSGNKVINPDIYEYKFPSWVKGIAGFWAQDLVDDKTYFASLQYLIDHGYISLNKTVHDYGNKTVTCVCDMK